MSGFEGVEAEGLMLCRDGYLFERVIRGVSIKAFRYLIIIVIVQNASRCM